MTTKLMYIMTAYYTSNHNFTANDASFYKNKKLANYTTCCQYVLLVKAVCIGRLFNGFVYMLASVDTFMLMTASGQAWIT